MKNCFIILLILPIFSRAQENLPSKDGKVFYEVIDSARSDKSDLYNRSRIWFVNTFKNARSVLQMDDKESGIIMGKGVTEFETGNVLIGSLPMYLHYTININLKDSKYRIQVYDIYASSDESKFTYSAEDLLKHPVMNKRKIRRIDSDVRSTIASYQQAIFKKNSSDF